MLAPATTPIHEAVYRNTALLLCGLLGAIALLALCIWASATLAPDGDSLMHMVFASLGLFVLVFVVCLLLALRRHRWTISEDAVLVAERPLVPFTGRRRAATVPHGAIAGLFSVQSMREALLEMRTRDGRRFVLPPALLPGEGPKGIRYPDQGGLTEFAEQLRAATAAAGHALPPVAPGIGFWNGMPGLAVLGVALVASTALAGVAVWAMSEGAAARQRGGEVVGILVMLPLGLGWLMRKAWRRRRALSGASR